MLAAFFIKAMREVWWKSFRTLPPLEAAASLPANVSSLRYSLMRALQQIRSTSLHQFGHNGVFDYYVAGDSPVHPMIATILIKNDWVVVGRPHWVEAIVQYQLSSAGLTLKNQLEAWWADLTLQQRLRAALLE